MPHARGVALAGLSAVIVALWAVGHLTQASVLPQIAWIYPIATMAATVTMLWLLAVTLERRKGRKPARSTLSRDPAGSVAAPTA